LEKIRQSVTENLNDLDSAMPNARISTIAWISRNLLELAIWSAFCALSKNNAKQFVLDAGRDATDVMNVPDGILSQTFSFRNARAETIGQLREEGFETLDQPFTAVSKVAKELGQDDLFKGYNKLLSKFAHPTALLVIQGGAPVLDGIKVKIHAMGVELGTQTLQFIADALERLGRSNPI
jgi:hypothetical protein